MSDIHAGPLAHPAFRVGLLLSHAPANSTPDRFQGELSRTRVRPCRSDSMIDRVTMPLTDPVPTWPIWNESNKAGSACLPHARRA